MMIKCNLCDSSQNEINRYIKHTKSAHCIPGYIPTLMCPFPSCKNRVYHISNSFRSHMKSYDNPKQQTNNDNIESSAVPCLTVPSENIRLQEQPIGEELEI